MMHRVACSLLLLLACRPTPSGELEPETQTPPGSAVIEANDAAQLVALADRITTVVVVDADRKPIGELPADVVDGLRGNLLEHGIGADLTAATPPWEVALQITVPGRAAFVAIPVGFDRARLSPAHPYDARIADEAGRIDPSVHEVVVGEAVHEAIRMLVGPPVAKEFQAPPGDDLSDLER